MNISLSFIKVPPEILTDLASLKEEVSYLHMLKMILNDSHRMPSY